MSDYIALVPLSVQLFFVAIVGLVLGSFATALTHRIPLGQDIGFNKKVRSECTSCGHKLSTLDLFPVFSWLFLKGQCRYCKARISVLYPAIELACVAAVLGIYAVYGFTAQGMVALFAMPFLLALLAIDLRHFILPDALVGGLLVFGFMFHGWQAVHFIVPALSFAVILWLLGWIMGRLLKKEALGFGDVKFFGVAGFWLGFPALAPLCLMAGMFGVVMGLVWKVALKSDIFPFGPALIVSFYACLLLRGLNII
ncbi:MAG TPA: prepilin peptidase [Alphaproteobacteria bacterium]|nr:prepilin peptidase [Alphaproteobacteria bacterium]